MNQVYLTSIELQQFRSFAELRVDMAAEPGVLIVHGSNVLGKSSLFDALEWSLTDNIDHFRPANGYEKVGEYLCRWRDEPGATRVALSFSDGNLLERQLASPLATSSIVKGTLRSPEEIAAFLKAPDWTPRIRALNRYLLLTHFLGQSSISRLTHRSDDERFEILKEAAQSAELEDFGIALHGKGSNLAARAFTRRIEALGRDASELTELLAQEDQLWQGAQASGAIDDDSAQHLTAQIFDWLRGAAPAAGLPFDEVKDDTPQAAIDKLIESARSRSLAISQARLLVDEQQRIKLRLAEYEAAQEVARRDLTSVTAVAEAAATAATEQRNRATAELKNLNDAKGAYGQLMELQKAMARLVRIGADQREVGTQLIQAEKLLASAEREVDLADRRRQLLARLRNEIEAIDGDSAAARDEAERVGEWLERTQLITNLRADHDALTRDHQGIVALVSTTEQAAREAGQAADAQAKLLNEMQASVGTLTAAVTAIAANLHPDACNCPVCNTRFDTPSALQRQASQAAERLAPLLVAQQQAFQLARTAADNASARYVSARDMQTRIRDAAEVIVGEQTVNNRLLERIAWVGPADVSSLEGYRTSLLDGVAKLQQQRQRRLRWIGSVGDDAAPASATIAIRRRDDCLRRRDALARHAAELMTAGEQTSAEISSRALAVFPGETTPPVAELVTASLEAAAGRLAQAQKVADAAQLSASEMDARSLGHQESIASANVRIAELTEHLKEALADSDRIKGRWRELGWPDTGTQAGELEEAEQRLAETESALGRATNLLRRLREGREAWARQQAHRASFERLRLASDLAPNSEREQIREAVQRNLGKKQVQLAATRQAKQIAAATSTDIATEVEEFNAEYIQPLDTLMKAVNRAILCDPRVGIDLHVRRKKIAQTAARDGELPPGGAIDPLLVHSEGQMAALAVSMLCAASLTYPWSRWRALILDDPLQHNDAIHAAAFADFIGNMVQQQGYQILLSTHDLGQAEFLQRKFDARRVHCRTLSLLGRGKDGVEWVIKDRKEAKDTTPRPTSEGAVLG